MQTQEFPKALTQDAATRAPLASAAYSLRLPVPTHLPTQGQGEGTPTHSLPCYPPPSGGGTTPAICRGSQGEGTHLAPAQAGD